MTRKFLEDLGLEKEIIDKVLDEHSSSVGQLKGEIENAKSTIDTLKAETVTLKEGLTERDTQLETLKTSSDDIETLKAKIETLQNDNKSKDEAHVAELKALKLEHAIDKGLADAKAKNIIAVKALLKKEELELQEDGTVKSLSEQLNEMVNSDDTKFLFDVDSKQSFKGAIPGETGNEDPDGKVDFSSMSYDEIRTYYEDHDQD